MPTEAILVIPVIVRAEPTTDPTVIFGVPVNPCALVAVPEKVVAVTIPPKAVIALPTFKVVAVATPVTARVVVVVTPVTTAPLEKPTEPSSSLLTISLTYN